MYEFSDDSPRASRKRSAAASNAFTHGLGHLPRYTLYRNRYKIWVRSTASGDQTVYSTCRREWQMKIVISYSYFLRHYGGWRPSGRITRRLISHAPRTGNRISSHPHRAQPQASRTSRGCGKRFPTMVLTSRLASPGRAKAGPQGFSLAQMHFERSLHHRGSGGNGQSDEGPDTAYVQSLPAESALRSGRVN